MNKQEYLQAINKIELNNEKIKKVKDTYKVEIPDDLGRVISYAGEVSFFDEERRALSLDGIICANEDTGVDFVSKKMIPVIDAYDMDYIVYLSEKQQWAKYNIVDDVIYEEADILEDIL